MNYDDCEMEHQEGSTEDAQNMNFTSLGPFAYFSTVVLVFKSFSQNRAGFLSDISGACSFLAIHCHAGKPPVVLDVLL